MAEAGSSGVLGLSTPGPLSCKGQGEAWPEIWVRGWSKLGSTDLPSSLPSSLPNSLLSRNCAGKQAGCFYSGRARA